MPRDISQQVKRLYDRLTAELDHYSKGQKFLSIRHIMDQCEASRRTVERVLRKLEGERQIVIEKTHGVFVNRERNRKIRHIVSIHADWPSEYWRSLDLAIEAELGRRGQYKFTPALYNPDDSRDYLQFINERMGDAIILEHPVDMSNIAELAQVINTRIPIIFMADSMYCSGIHAVNTHPEFTGMLAADHFLRKGHSRLALIISEPWNPGEQRIAGGYCDFLTLHGITPEIIDCKVVNGDASRSKTHDAVLDYLCRFGATFTGCFALSDYSAFGVIDAVNDYELRVPDDISVIGCFGSISGAHFHPPLTTVGNNIGEIAELVGKGLDDLFSGGTFGLRSTRASIIERQSVKNLAR